MATTFGAAGSLAVLLMWLYFSAAVLLLGAEFAAARARMRDPRGAWGLTQAIPPGSRAKLASVLAASTVPDMQHGDATQSGAASSSPADNKRGVAVRASSPGAAQMITPQRNVIAKNNGSRAKRVLQAQQHATYATALALVRAGRTAGAARRYAERHPWGSVVIAAGAALAMTVAGRRRGEKPRSDSAKNR
jgi:membrane protein